MALIATGNGIREAVSTGLVARDTAFHEIPLIDLAPMAGSDPMAKRQTAAAVRKACIDVGFFYIRNHGVPQAVIDNMFAQGPRFFSQPLDQKLKFHVKNSTNNSGYTPLLEENTDPSARGDLHEAYDVGLELAPDDPILRLGYARYGLNQWPSGVPGFREAMTRYGEEMLALGQRLFGVFALALDLPEDYFVPLTRKPISDLRIVHYPPQTGEIDERQIGIGAHSDYECFTILAQDSVPALQVLNGLGEWIVAPPIPGTFVVNIGDLMARWTNDLFASTIHRAINRSGVVRYSIPYFLGTDYDTPIEALPGCAGPERPAKYPRVIAGDYVESRFDATYGYRGQDQAD